jgi:low temperature requirement protein LtrA
VAKTASTTLLRDPQNTERSTFLELFFDLVFAFALTTLADGLINHLQWHDVLETVILLPAVWWVWTLTVWMSDWLDPDRVPVQATVIMIMLGSLVMAAAVPGAFGRNGLAFAGTYVAVQAGRTLFFTWALRGHHLQVRGWRVLFWFGVSGTLWITGGLAGYWTRVTLWTAAVVLDYAIAASNYPTPGLGRSRSSDWRLAGEHLAERYRQFVIIALGEAILVTGSTFSGDVTLRRASAVVASFFSSVLLWRIYFHRVMDLVSAASALARPPAGIGRIAAYDHLPIVAGVVVSAVGDRLVLAAPGARAAPAWVATLVIGPALFVSGRALFEYTVFRRTSRTRLAGLGALAAAAPVMLLLPTLAAAVVVDLVLFGIALGDTLVDARNGPADTTSSPLAPP